MSRVGGNAGRLEIDLHPPVEPQLLLDLLEAARPDIERDMEELLAQGYTVDELLLARGDDCFLSVQPRPGAIPARRM